MQEIVFADLYIRDPFLAHLKTYQFFEKNKTDMRGHVCLNTLGIKKKRPSKSTGR
jgi:hypothetical protein